MLQGPSGYIDEYGAPFFRQGATVTPKVLVLVERTVKGENPGSVRVRTCHSQQDPWKELNPQEGVVPKHWISDIWVSRELLPFAMAGESSRAIIPRDGLGRLLASPGRKCDFWNELEGIYSEYCGQGRSTPKTLITQIDFNGKLASQLPLFSAGDRRMVLCPTSGDIMRASRISGNAVIDSTLYRWQAESEEEAAYLVGLLNAACLRVAFEQSRESGRHFHLHPWRKVPMSRFDGTDRDHRELVSLSQRAERIAEACVIENQGQLGQVGLSNLIRTKLVEDGVSAEIDDLVVKIMPDGVVVSD